jgi:predicted nuclease with TOPRIM domain
MALSDKQKADVIFFLGWPAKTLVEASTNYNRTTAQLLENLNTNIEGQVSDLLHKLKAQDERIDAAQDRMAALKVGDIELNPEEIDKLRNERNRLCKMLSRLLDIPMQSGGGAMFGVVV